MLKTCGMTSSWRRIVILTCLICLVLLGTFIQRRAASSETPKAFLTRIRGGRNKVTTLVMVPGHAAWLDGRWDVPGWLEKFIPDIEMQIKVALTQYDPKEALVLFSGGMTHPNVGKISEGQSYMDYAKSVHMTNSDKAYGEEYARDSLENVMFSICRFKEITGHYPERYVVVGFEFKRERFVNEHRRAVKFPPDNFEYRGVSQVPLESIKEQIDMERGGTIKQFQRDPYGCEPPLATKRIERDPFKRQHRYDEICPEMRGLLAACGENIYDGPLPWSR